MNISAWEKWNDIHSLDAQKKRLASAQKAECTPLSVEHDNCTGMFSGSSGTYKTSLTDCTCKDFIIKRQPCKHMYRLAIELGIYGLDVKSDVNAVKNNVKKATAKPWTLDKAIENIETLDNNLQIKLKEIIMPMLFKKQYISPILLFDGLNDLLSGGFLKEVYNPKLAGLALKRKDIIAILDQKQITGFKRNCKKEVLMDWISENVKDFEKLISPYATCVEISDEFRKAARKTYTYLIRKYDTEEIYDPETDDYIEVSKGMELVVSIDALTGNQTSSYKFPQDEVTRLLDKYNKKEVYKND